MKKRTKKIIYAVAGTLAFLLSAASVYAVSILPDEYFVRRIGLDIEALQEKENKFLNTGIKWTSPRGDSEFTLSELGSSTNFEEVKSYFEHFSDKNGPIKKTWILIFGKNINHELYLDDQKIQSNFSQSSVTKSATNAYYEYVDKNLTVHEEEIGFEIDFSVLESEIQKQWFTDDLVLSSPLPLKEIKPKVRKAQLEEKLVDVVALTEKTISMRDDKGQTWPIDFKEKVGWLYPENGNFKIYEDKFFTFIQTEVVSKVEQDPANVTITISEDGKYNFEGSARFGIKVNAPLLKQNFETALSGTGTMIDIATSITQPEINVPDSLKEMGITQLVGVGYSSYKGSPANRQHNIGVGLSRFNGIIIPKDEEFSFVKQLGPVDGAHGWLPELVIKGDDTIPEYGGGLCQVSSTMFRAVLYSGLPIVMRKNHSYAVSYYAFPFGYGLDATIYDPLPDLRFKNDTPAPILVQAYYEGFDVYYVFYGTNDGRRVQMEGPYSYDYNSVAEPSITYTDELEPGVRHLESYAHIGFKVDWYRTIFYADNTQSERELIHSNYEARPSKYTEGKAAEAIDES